ncbi:MAG: rhodanese-like domain-containing protein [Gammaproteobacteria bacterium]|nr:rhodanese-like domain-containing protein [Gammaproteobacteria bacterium]
MEGTGTYKYAGKVLGTLLLASVSTLLVACGQPSGSADMKSFVDVAQSAARQDDRVNVEELAEWLIEGRQDFVLIDVRSPSDYQKGQIGDAENVPLAQLVTDEKMKSLPSDRKIILYSNGSENAAKAAVMLRLAGLDAHLVTGGFNAWHQRILNPDISTEELDGESLEVSAQRAFSCYFVGDRGGSSEKRSDKVEPFVPPVFTPDEAAEAIPLPPPGQESC